VDCWYCEAAYLDHVIYSITYYLQDYIICRIILFTGFCYLNYYIIYTSIFSIFQMCKLNLKMVGIQRSGKWKGGK
jgi:hypothetical protein